MRAAMNGSGPRAGPPSSGYCTSAPNTRPSKAACGRSAPTCRSMPSGSARERSTSIVCGKQRSLTRNRLRSPAFRFVETRCSSVIASAAAVASSSSDALATSIPVRSVTIVWKLRSDSSRPCAISA